MRTWLLTILACSPALLPPAPAPAQWRMPTSWPSDAEVPAPRVPLAGSAARYLAAPAAAPALDPCGSPVAASVLGGALGGAAGGWLLWFATEEVASGGEASGSKTPYLLVGAAAGALFGLLHAGSC